MYSRVYFSDFCDRFHDMGRGDSFTYEGKRALFDYLEDLEADMGEDIELDVFALCCEFAEYPSAFCAALEQGYDDDPESPLDWLQDRGTVIVFSSGVIVTNI